MKLDELEEEEFTGKVSISNWAMSRAQKIIRDISFDSDCHDIYRPEYSSDGDTKDDLDRFEDEEAEGKICDERLSELNPCGEGSSNSDSLKSGPENLSSSPASELLQVGR